MYVYICIYVYMYVCMYIYNVCICRYVCMYVHKVYARFTYIGSVVYITQ